MYRKWYLQQDPVCDAYRATPKCSDVAVQRVRQSLSSPGFRRQIFDEPGIVERISSSARRRRLACQDVARHVSDGCFSDQEIDALIGLYLPHCPCCR